MNETERAQWLAARCGKLTASRMAEAINFRKDGKPSAERTNLMKELLAERLTQITMRHYVNSAMEHGIEFECEARSMYEVMTGEFVTASGFFDHPRIDMFGATPDGLLGADGLIETKCPTTQTYSSWRLAGVVPDEHIPQMLAQLACTGRKWVEFVAYDPRIRDERLRLFIRRFEPKPAEITAIETAAETFLAELDVLWEQLTTAAA